MTQAGTRAELAVARAAEAARAGRLDDARALLDDAGGAETPALLDLRARVLAQKGDLDGADAAWARLAELDPSNTAATAGRRAVADLRSGRSHRRQVRVLAGAGVAAVLIAGGILVAVTSGSWSSPSADPGPTASGPPPGRSAPVSPPPPSSPTVSASPAPVSVAPPAAGPVSSLAGDLAVPGVIAVPTGRTIDVTFPDGLFAYDARLSPSGARALDGLANHLTGHLDDVTGVELVGHSVVVAGGPDRGGSTVALARAERVATELADRTGLPLTRFRLSVAEQDPLVGNGGPRRTVTMRLDVRS